MAVRAALEWNLVFQWPRLFQVACGCQGIPGAGDPAPKSCDGGKRAPAPSIRRRGALPPSSAAGALLAVPAVPAAPRAACKMSVRRGQRLAGPGIRLSWLLCCSALLSPAAGYVIVSSVSWAVTNEVDEELDSASTEEAMPALLEDSGSIWQRSFPASAHKEDAHLPPPAGTARARPSPAPPGMFSYRRESGPRLRPSTARFLAHASTWGCLATVSAHEKIPGLPFGNCVPISDGPLNNSTGIPYFYVTPKDPVVANLMKNPMASLLLPESEGEFCSSRPLSKVRLVNFPNLAPS
ncbi:protein CREG2 isoform X2 [Rhinolophus sinicus]|uniref:protein CREG2 isoform X2 n=1 Tax=Rhinolophus sinicus TaxID=89399 RepID=UPI003D7B1507